MIASYFSLWAGLLMSGPLTLAIALTCLFMPVLVFWKTRTRKWRALTLRLLALLPLGLSFIQVIPLLDVVERIVTHEISGFDTDYAMLGALAQIRALLYVGGGSAVASMLALSASPKPIANPE